jgi:hypothetical protein
LVAYAQFGSACCTRADSRRTNRAVFLWAPDGTGEPWPRWRVWKGTYISDPSSHVKDSFISSESSEPRAEISRHRQADRGGCRDLTCGSPQHGAGTGEGCTRSDWGADEKVLLVLAATGWLASRGCDEPLRRAGNHALLVTVGASLLPHVMKTLFDQTRPEDVLGISVAFRFRASGRMPFPRATRCTWGRSHRLRARCRPALVGHPDVRSRSLADAHRGAGSLGK